MAVDDEVLEKKSSPRSKRKLNGPNFTWPLLMFSSAISEGLASRIGELYKPKPVTIKTTGNN